MRKDKLLQFVVCLHWVLFIVGMVLSTVLEDQLPAPLQEWVQAEFERDFTPEEDVLYGSVLVLLVLQLVASLGLLMLERWGAWLYVGTAVVGYMVLFFLDTPTVEHPIAAGVYDIVTVLEGVIIGMIFMGGEIFDRRSEELGVQTDPSKQLKSTTPSHCHHCKVPLPSTHTADTCPKCGEVTESQSSVRGFSLQNPGSQFMLVAWGLAALLLTALTLFMLGGGWRGSRVPVYVAGITLINVAYVVHRFIVFHRTRKGQCDVEWRISLNGIRIVADQRVVSEAVSWSTIKKIQIDRGIGAGKSGWRALTIEPELKKLKWFDLRDGSDASAPAHIPSSIWIPDVELRQMGEIRRSILEFRP